MKIRFDFDPQREDGVQAVSKELEGIHGYALFVADDERVEVDNYIDGDPSDIVGLLITMAKCCGNLAEELEETVKELMAAENGGSEDES